MTSFNPSAETLPNPAVPGWYWAVPRIGLVLVFVAMGALLWVLHRNELESQRLQLISDVLWVEQDLRFHLSKAQDVLAELGREAAEQHVTPETIGNPIRLLMRNNPWLVQIIWYDEGRRVAAAIPPRVGEFAVGETAGAVPSPETFELARSLGKPVFSPSYPAINEDYQIELHVPQFRGGRLVNMMVGVVSLKDLLHDAVPWWHAEKYQLQVTDHTGAVLATKSKVAAGTSGMSYTVAFDPPGRGLQIQATAYKADTGLLRNVLAVTIVTLTLSVLWSMWALRRHVQRRYAAEVALREEHAFRKAMEDSLFTGLRARDLKGRITYVNPAFCRMVGWSESELVGRDPPMPYWAPESYDEIRAVHDGILAGSHAFEGIELTLVRRNGERFDALIYEAPLIDAHGRQTGWMGSVLDITARKRAEEMYRQQQEKLQFTSRLVTMGEMASTLAHEINQPLSAIASYNTGCLNKLESGDFSREELTQVLRKVGAQAQRAGQIIRRVYDFVRRTTPKRAACELNAVVEDALGLIEAQARKRGVRIHTQLAADLPPVLIDRIMIEQVILNLVRNAMDAMAELAPERRQLTLTTGRIEAAVLVSVEDQGSGISAEAEAKLFAPFYTTKEEGMGMGLNICRSIMELHKGRLWHEPGRAGGTVFFVSIPLGGA